MPDHDTMRDLRVSICITIADTPFQHDVDSLLSFFKESGYETRREWVQEALSQLLWVDVLKRDKRFVYSQGEKFQQYMNEMSSHYTQQ